MVYLPLAVCSYSSCKAARVKFSVAFFLFGWVEGGGGGGGGSRLSER